MSQTQGEERDGETSTRTTEAEQCLEREIEKEIAKLKYYLEETDELISSQDYGEMTTVEKRVAKIDENLRELISQMEELKIEQGKTPRTVRQWKKEIKTSYAPLIEEKEKIANILRDKQREIKEEEERQIVQAQERQRRIATRAQEEEIIRQQEREELVQQHRLEQERRLLQEKMEAEIKITEKKLEMENRAKSTVAKLPKLRISPFNGTAADWIRFENMFISQVHSKPISDEEKFGYLLEMVQRKVREKISNLKPSTPGYQTAWERLKKEYGHTALVVNAHMDSIINLQVVKGTNYTRVKEFYENLSRNFDALQTLGESDMLRGFVMSTLNKLVHVKADLVRTDDNWEKWRMEDLLESLRKWLRRNAVEDSTRHGRDDSNKERQWYTQKGNGRFPPKQKKCIFCEGEHWSDSCQIQDTKEKRKAFFVSKRLCFNCGISGHRGSNCRSRGCLKCQGRHHTSLCDRRRDDDAVLTGYTPSVEEATMPAIIPVKIKGHTF